MSKTAEQKALEAYPQKYDNLLDTNVHRRIGYRQGYDQAMQDFMNNACEWLRHNTMRELVLDSESTELVEDFVEDFKNYMQNEM